jgi:cytidine deaminase
MAFNAIRRVLETIGEAASGKASDVAREKPQGKEDSIAAPSPQFAEMYRSIDAAFTEAKGPPAPFMAVRAERDAGWASQEARGGVSNPVRAPKIDRERQIMSAAPYRALKLVGEESPAREGAETVPARLFGAARQAMRQSHSPYSEFPVGAALISESGVIYAGCNVENASFPEGWCAETSAIAHMIRAGERKIVELAVVAEKMPRVTPCGGCRQRIREFGSAETRIHLCDLSGVVETLTLEQLFPRSF